MRTFEVEDLILKELSGLYNRNEQDSIFFRIVKVNKFKDIFPIIDQANRDQNFSVIAMSGISITDERSKKYDFSTPYIIVKEGVYSLNKDLNKDSWKSAHTKIGYVKGNLEEKRIKSLITKYNIIGIPYVRFKEKVNGLYKGEVAFILGENTTSWNNKVIHKIDHFNHQYGKGFGILYPKNFPFKRKFNKYLYYLIRSKSFTSAIKNVLGEDYADYLKKKR